MRWYRSRQLRRCAWWPAAGALHGDAGVTLVELLTAMFVMGLGMTVFTTAILQVYQSMEWTERAALVRDQVSAAFRKLDRELRYATEISTPGSAVTDNIDYWYVEYVTTRNSMDSCSQVRLPKSQSGITASNSQLQIRTWPLGNSSHGAYINVAWNVQPPTVNPFTQPAPTQLQIQLTAYGDPKVTTGAGVAQTNVVFTAINSTGTTVKAAQCAAQRTNDQ